MSDSTAFTNALRVVCEVYERAGLVRTGKGAYTTVNELTDQMPAVRPEVLKAATTILWNIGTDRAWTLANKVLSEEDKGAILAGLVAVQWNLPLAMARHNVPYLIPGSFLVDLEMEYMDAQLTVNGLEADDQVIIIDDTLASGGTLASLIHGCRAAGVEVLEARVVVEKLGYGGRERIEGLGVPVFAGIGIDVRGGQVEVKETYGG